LLFWLLYCACLALMVKYLDVCACVYGVKTINICPTTTWGPLMVAQWLRYSATNRKVAGSIPDDVIGIFH
jgi:hypothetical protein